MKDLVKFSDFSPNDSVSILFDIEFEGKPLTTLTYKDKYCWLAMEVGDALGYSKSGKSLPSKIGHEWKNEFIKDHDYVVVKGPELVDIKRLLEVNPDNGFTYSQHVMLLFEPGVYMVCQKTRKPTGMRLRRFLASEVLNQIARDGKYLPEREVVNGQLVNKEQNNFAVRDIELQLAIRQQKYEGYKYLVGVLKKRGYSKDTIINYEIAAAEALTDENFAMLKPVVDDAWETPTQIAERNGVTLSRVGLIIKDLGLKGDISGICRSYLNKAKTCNREVKCYLYSPDAVKKIESDIRVWKMGWGL